MQILIQIKAILVGFVLLVFALVPACLVALPFKTGRRLKIVGPVWSAFGSGVLRYGCGTKISISEDHRSKEFGGTPCYGLYIANHQSYMDIPLMCTKYQAPPIMKKEVLNIPIIGWMAWISGALPVSRTQTSSRRKVFEKAKKRVLKEKIGLQVYPEGTRSKDSLPKSFPQIKKTLLVFAFNEKIPVVPTSIYGTRGILTKSGIIKPGRHVGIIVHKEIYPSSFETADEFAEACWNVVIQGHDQMKSQLGPLNENLSLA
jgi:1-acyl-sn-glycerol-3-phosphate acyltransferase